MSKSTITQPSTESFKNLIDLLAVYSDGKARMDAMQAEINQGYFELVDDRRKEYTDLQEAISKSEAAIEALVIAHPEWFGSKKSIPTAYGTVSKRNSTKLDISNEEASIILIEHAFEKDEEKRNLYLRQQKTLNLEALEKLDDGELRRFRITRVTEENVSVKAKKIDLGKAIAADAEKEAA